MMTDDQYESLRRHILNLSVEVQEMKLELKRQNEMADHRFSLLYEWCAPADYKAALEAEALPTQIDIPPDLKKFFPDQD